MSQVHILTFSEQISCNWPHSRWAYCFHPLPWVIMWPNCDLRRVAATVSKTHVWNKLQSV